MKFATLVFCLSFVSLAANVSAATVDRPDVVKQLQVKDGDYVVTSVDLIAKEDKLCTEGQQFKWSPTEDQALCEKGAVHPVTLTDHAGKVTLSFGQAASFSDFNAGLVTEAPQSKRNCVISHNTQSLVGRVIDDSYLNCSDEKTSTHAEIEIKDGVMNYKQVTKITRGAKIVCIPLKCSLTLKPKK